MEPPAEQTSHVAYIHSGSHLKASVALDAVELLLVAGPSMDQLLSHPVAQLDGSALPYETILLSFEVLGRPRIHVEHPSKARGPLPGLALPSSLLFSVLLITDPSVLDLGHDMLDPHGIMFQSEQIGNVRILEIQLLA